MSRRSMFGNKQAGPEKGGVAYMQQQYSISRGNLLAAIVFTVVNLVLLLADSNWYFPFSIAIPYYGTLLGQVWEVGNIMLGVAAVLLAVYFVCWLLSKKHWGVMILALVLFLLDCAALVGIMVLGELYSSMTLDILFHIWVVYYLVQAVRYGAKLQAMRGNGPVSANSESGTAPDAARAGYVGPEIDAKPEVKNRGPEID